MVQDSQSMMPRTLVLALCVLGACGNKNAAAPPPPPAVVDLPAAIALPREAGAAVTVVPTSAKDAIDPKHDEKIAGTDATGMAFVRNEREVLFHDASLGHDPRTIAWSRRAPAGVSRVVLAGDMVYVVSGDTAGESFVHALERSSGATRWARVVQAMSLVLLPTDGGLAWVRDSVLSEVSLDRGVELWSWAFEHEPNHVRRIEGSDWLVSGDEIDTTRLHIDATRRETPVRITGHARVLGFPSNEGIAVGANGQWTATTRADGSFELVVPVHGTLTFWSSTPYDERAKAIERATIGPHRYAFGSYMSAIDAERAAHDGLEIELGGGTIPNRD
jgi:hypothetical protein